jgi:hypothetical protein
MFIHITKNLASILTFKIIKEAVKFNRIAKVL